MVACVIMHLRPLASFLLGLSMIGGALAIKPTEERTWTSTSGTKVTAVALELTKNGSVELETPDSRKITLGIDHFSQADQDFLEKHFRGSGDVAGPPLNTGTHRGPIEADADTSYYLYLPKDFDKSAKSPVMIWMYSQGLYEGLASRTTEAKSFERRVLPWLKELTETSGEDAAYLAQTLAKECPLRGSFKNEIDEFRSKLGQSEAAIAHVKGREALDEFSKKELSKYGDHYSPLKEHAPKKFERMNELLADKNPKAKDLHEIFKQLAKPTHR